MAYLGMTAGELIDIMHAEDLAKFRHKKNGSLNQKGTRRRSMFSVHFNQKLNGERNCSTVYKRSLEATLNLPERALDTSRWREIVSGDTEW